MSLSMKKELAALEQMTVGQLRERYAEVFGEAARSRHRQYLVRRIAWRLQANAEGGLSERALRRAEELANVADVRVTPPKGSMPGRSAPSLAPIVARARVSSDPRLTLNILLSFAQFEREIIGERIRDKIAASRQRGKWTGGTPILGYDVDRSNGGPRLAPPH